jgi:uncharacterized protein
MFTRSGDWFSRAVLYALAFFALVFTCAKTAWAEPYTPTISRPVSDFAVVTDAGSVAAIERALNDHYRSTNTQIAILTLDSIDEPIEDLALRTATRWGGGRRGRDDGILVVFAIQQRRSRIEVGYGLESVVTDARARAILDSARPELVAGDYAAALAKVAEALIAATGGSADIVLPTTRVITRTSPPRNSDRVTNREIILYGAILLLLVAFVAILFFAPHWITNFASSGYRRSSYSSYSSYSSSSSWSSGSSSSRSSSSSSSSYSGGGGSFGGGGASSSW